MSLVPVAPWFPAAAPDPTERAAVIASLTFFLLNAGVMFAIWWWSGRKKRQPPRSPEPAGAPADELSVTDVLGWEFDYARTTASEAMQDRHTMVNFYLFITGIIGSGVVAIVSATDQSRLRFGTVLLWLLCGVGWLYFLKLVKLRQAWHDSARAMNQIKTFYIAHAPIQGADLREAFRWKPETLPPAGQPWTVFAYSASLIGFLNSAAFVGGGFLWTGAATTPSVSTMVVLAAFGVAFFVLHVELYFLFLREPSKE